MANKKITQLPAATTPLAGTEVVPLVQGGITAQVAASALMPSLTGEATSVLNVTTLTNSAVIGKVITGYTSGAGTVAATDTILQAIQKLNGNTVAAGAGTVQSVSVVTANGMSGTVANPTTTPAITLTPPGLSNLTDVAISTPLVNQLLGYNGSNWVNTNAASAGAGTGVVFYNATPLISAAGTQNNTQIATLATTPVVTTEQTITGTATSNTVLFSAFVSAALNRTIIDSGIWAFANWAGLNSHTGTNTLTRQVYTAIPFLTGTVTMTGTGSTRTATASAGTPFATAVIDASATNTTASYLQTPSGLYQITARTSDTVVTIGDVPTTYINEATVAGTVLKKLFGITTGAISNVTPDYGLYEVTTTATSYAITAATGLGILGFFTSSTTHTITVPYNGTEHNTHVNSPLVNVHNDLAGLNGGTSGQYYHLTSAEYTGTGSGNFVRATNATLVGPALGTPASGVLTNCTGLPVAGGGTGVTTSTGSGANVLNTTPTLITPLLGTPTSGVLTNCTGLPIAGISGSAGIAQLAVAATFTTPQRGTVTTANTAAFNQSVTNNFQCTPAATVSLTFSNHTSGQSGYVLLINTGGYAITAAATTKLGSTTLATISIAGTYLLSYFDNGTNAYVTASGILA